MQIKFDEMVAHLRKIRSEHGDESFHVALKGLFRSLIPTPGGDAYIRRLLQEFGVSEDTYDQMKAEVLERAKEPPKGATEVVLEAIKKEMPACKTQAHFDIVIQAWDALRICLNASFSRDLQTATQARQGLNTLLDLAPKVGELHQKIEESPEATTNQDYVKTPKQFTEYDMQRSLLAELSEIGSRVQLDAWYVSSREMMDSVVNPKLRNQLFDAIRTKKQTFSN